MKLHNKYQWPGLIVSEVFKYFPIRVYVKHVNSGTGRFLTPGLKKLHTKCKRPGPSCFRQKENKDFFFFFFFFFFCRPRSDSAERGVLLVAPPFAINPAVLETTCSKMDLCRIYFILFFYFYLFIYFLLLFYH